MSQIVLLSVWGFVIGFAGIGVVLLIFILIYYNKFVSLRTKIREALSGIDVQMQRRQDLMPRLESVVSDKTEEFRKISQIGRHAIDVENPTQKAGGDAAVGARLAKVLIEARRQADALGKEEINRLEADLKEIENHLQMARRYYNALVRDYNALCEKFPSVIIATLIRFQKAEFFLPNENLSEESLTP